MKSAEDWLSRLVDLPPKKDWLEMSNTDAINLIKQIQLDAAKWAMTEAAKMVEEDISSGENKDPWTITRDVAYGNMKATILTRRDNLIVEDMK